MKRFQTLHGGAGALSMVNLEQKRLEEGVIEKGEERGVCGDIKREQTRSSGVTVIKIVGFKVEKR